MIHDLCITGTAKTCFSAWLYVPVQATKHLYNTLLNIDLDARGGGKESETWFMSGIRAGFRFGWTPFSLSEAACNIWWGNLGRPTLFLFSQKAKVTDSFGREKIALRLFRCDCRKREKIVSEGRGTAETRSCGACLALDPLETDENSVIAKKKKLDFC